MQSRSLKLLKQRFKRSLFLSVGLCAVVGLSAIFDIAVRTMNPLVILFAIAVVWALMFGYLNISYTREFIYRVFNVENE